MRILRKNGVVAQSETTEPGNLATILRALRLREGLTSSQLAKRSEVSLSTISKIEGGTLLPGYEIIQKLAIGLQVDVGELFKPRTDTATAGRRGVTRRHAGTRLETEHYVYEALGADISNKEFLPLLAQIKAHKRTEFPKLSSHAGEEFVYVLEGAVNLFSDLYEPLRLDTGDSVYFDSSSGHALVSIGDQDAKVIWICSHRDALRVASGDNGQS